MAYDAKSISGTTVKVETGIRYIARDLDGKFATTTNGELIKKSNGEILPNDEPLFVIRARDRLAIKLLLAYRAMSIDDGCNEYQMEKVGAAIQLFRDFANEHPDRMKQPSVTKGQ